MDLVLNNNGQLITTSRLVAKKFGKRHSNILRDIDNLECPQDFTQLNFEFSEYTDPTGRKLREYIITKDGFSFLAMGFTGKEASKFKVDYINAFNRMESELTKPKELSRLELIQLALESEKENIELQKQVKYLEPKAIMYDKVMDNGELIDIGQLAKILKIPKVGRNKMFELLRTKGIFFNNRNEPKQEYINRGYFQLRFKTIERNSSPDMTVTKVLVTKQGLKYLASSLGVDNNNSFNTMQLN